MKLKHGIQAVEKTAHVAYILLAEKTDTNGDSHNNGKYTMYINVSQPAADHAKGIREGENLNPVKTLRMRYDAFVELTSAAVGDFGRAERIRVRGHDSRGEPRDLRLVLPHERLDLSA